MQIRADIWYSRDGGQTWGQRPGFRTFCGQQPDLILVIVNYALRDAPDLHRRGITVFIHIRILDQPPF